jgi:hypothetical protein
MAHRPLPSIGSDSNRPITSARRTTAADRPFSTGRSDNLPGKPLPKRQQQSFYRSFAFVAPTDRPFTSPAVNGYSPNQMDNHIQYIDWQEPPRVATAPVGSSPRRMGKPQVGQPVQLLFHVRKTHQTNIDWTYYII